MQHKRSVFVVGGGGMVGATVAQTIAIKELVNDIVLIDVAESLVHGQAIDINHATAYTNGVHVRVGDYSDIKEDDIVVIACGVSMSQHAVKNRLALLDTNTRIVNDVVSKLVARGKSVYIIVVTNPVDILTYTTLKASGLPKERVFGTGTALDTARLQVTIAHALHVSQQQVQAYILGEHGDSSFPALAHASIGGIPLTKFPGFKPKMIETIDKDIREAALSIIKAKRSTYYGIGHVVAKLIEALVRDTASVFPVCSLVTGQYNLSDIAISLPTMLSSKGVQILEDHPLSGEETRRLHASAQVIRNAMANANIVTA